MFTTAKQAAPSAMQRGAAFSLAAVVTISILANINGLATAPAPYSLLAAGAAHVALAKVAANS